jgi:C4-dicarboxylate-specific signal transduction histidine kinase
MADPVQLQQVIFNLVMNAIEAMSSTAAGSRVLQLRSEATETGECIVAIEDSGPGIEPETLKRIFEPFFTSKSKGMGMGLSICRSIGEAHGGRLSADSAKPRGAIFRHPWRRAAVCKPYNATENRPSVALTSRGRAYSGPDIQGRRNC